MNLMLIADVMADSPLTSLLPDYGGVTHALVHVGLIAAFFGLPAGIFIWAERKVSARIQDRLGPTRTGGKFGWLQSLADGIKLVQKEDLCPKDADKPLFRVAPYIVVSASLAAYLVLPFSENWSALGLDVGLFFLLALLALEVLGVIFAGYSSGSKWALYGSMRESAQMVSYEIPMGICALVPIVFAGSLDLNDVVRTQITTFADFRATGIPPLLNWYVFNPIGLIAFLCYFTCATASCKRAPFDLAEAESELVAGFLTEYSGMRWSFFFLAEYASMFLVSGVATALFLGGWDDGFGMVAGLKSLGGDPLSVSGILATLLGAVVFMSKASLLVCVQIWVRWTLPRIRIDQVMTACLKYMVPIACTLFLAATIYPLVAVAATQKMSSDGKGRPYFLPTTVPVAERVKPRKALPKPVPLPQAEQTPEAPEHK